MFGGGSFQPFIDHDGPPFVRHDSNLVEIEARRVRRASRRHEQLLPSKFTAISRNDELVPELFLFSFFLFFLAKGDRMHLCKES